MTISKALALGLSLLLAVPGCAARSGTRLSPPPSQLTEADRAILTEYVRRLPPGAEVRVDLTGGRVRRGSLMKVTDRSLILQPRTRLPEPPLDVPLEELLRVTLDPQSGTSVGKMIGIGIGAGAGAALAVIMLLVALIDN